MEYIKDDHILSYINNEIDIRLHCTYEGKAYEVVKFRPDYTDYYKLGIDAFVLFKMALDNDTYEIIHNVDYITCNFTNGDIKLSLILDRIRINTLDLSVLSVKAELRREISELREEIADLREMMTKKDAEYSKLLLMIEKNTSYVKIKNDSEHAVIDSDKLLTNNNVKYGIQDKYIDLTDIFIHKYYNSISKVTVLNDIGVDPVPGIVKQLIIICTINNVSYTNTHPEYLLNDICL